MPAAEKTGWRDTQLLTKHVERDLACHVAGVRFPLLEYANSKLVALIDYHTWEGGFPDHEHPLYRALSAQMGILPFIIAFYDKRFGFYLFPVNLPARGMLSDEASRLKSEREFVVWLHEIRGLRTDQPLVWNKNRPSLPNLDHLYDHRPASPPSASVSVSRYLELQATLWTGEELSRRRRHVHDGHPGYGFACGAVDADYVLADYNRNNGRLLAVLEYKSEGATIDWRKTNIKVVQQFAAPLPLFVSRYIRPSHKSDRWLFRLVEPGREERKTDPWLDEPHWFDFLHSLRVRNYQEGAAT